MKFLCVRCDDAMRLERAEGPEDGTLRAVFTCPACGTRIAMLTNPWETQLVRALDVKIGGRSAPAQPLEFVRSMLASPREAGPAAGSEAPPAPACPFSAVANRSAEQASITWDAAAERRLERIPEFIRPMARQGIEQFASRHGYRHITEDVMEEARGAFGM